MNPSSPDAAARILVVDDDEGNRDALSRRLQRQGFRVTAAADGNAALARLAAEEFDLVLLDVMMPGISGLEVLERLRRDREPTRLPVIMATAKDGTDDVVAALKLGANDYVTKPLDFPIVLARVRTQLALKQSVEQVLDLQRRLADQNAELQAANDGLVRAAERTRRDLLAAARVQETFLPAAKPAVAGVSSDWAFKPCEELAGDALNLIALDDDHLAFYVLDVTGHGVAASLLAVTATRLLSATDPPDSIVIAPDVNATSAAAATNGNGNGAITPAHPRDVAGRLNQRFRFNEQTEQYLTLFYAVLDARTRELRYVSAGHPGAIRLSPGHPPRVLPGTGLPIGIGEGYEDQSVQLAPGDRIVLYSDGVTESMNPARELFGTPRLLESLTRSTTHPLPTTIPTLLQELEAWRANTPLTDDISLVAIECP